MNPSPRLRLHAARLVLLVACVGVVATSPAHSPQVFAEHEAPPLTLRTTSARARRLLRLEISSTKPSSHAVDVDVTAHVTARWRPADATQTVKPWFRAQLSVGSGTSGGEGSVVLGEPGQPVGRAVAAASVEGTDEVPEGFTVRFLEP